MDPLGKLLLARFEPMESLRKGQWEHKWQRIADHLTGRRDFLVREDPGRRRDVDLYDTTGRTMVDLLSGGLHSLLTNPATEWFDLKTRDERLMEIHAVNVWLDTVRKRLLSVFQSPAGRFTGQSDEVYLDIVAFGTGTMFIGDTPGEPVLFSARPISEIYIEENERGEVDTVFRCFQMTSRNCVRKWGTRAPEAARKNVADNKPMEKVDILHCTYPSDDPGKKLPFTDIAMRYASAFVAKDRGDICGIPSGYPEKPYIVARWRVDGGEVYGRGPGDNALADQMMASEMKKTSLQAGQMAVAPPFLTEDDSSIVQLDMRPFGRNIVKPGSVLNPPIQPLDFKSRADIGIDLIRDTRQQVEEAFHFELLKLIQNRGLTPMTARQATLIQNSVERLLAPMLGRQHEDYLGPLIDRVYGIEARRGNLPPPPPQLAGQELRIEYLSPITRAQRRSDVDATVEWLNILLTLGQSRPDVMDLAKMDEALRYIGIQGDVPPSLMRSRAEMEEIRAANEALADEQARQEQAAQVAKNLGTAAPAIQALQNL